MGLRSVMVEWVLAAVGVGASGLLLHRVVARRRRRGPGPTIASLGDAAGASITVEGKVVGPTTRSPVSWHPCAAWWCWVARADRGGSWQEVGGAALGVFALDDGTGRVELDATQCRPDVRPGAEVVITRREWPPRATSAPHDALRRVCEASGLDQPETVDAVRVQESLLPVGAVVAARGLVVLGPGGTADGGYRGQTAGTATLCPPPGGWIELTPR